MNVLIFGLGLLLVQMVGKGIAASDSPNARWLPHIRDASGQLVPTF